MMQNQVYIYAWGNNIKRATLKGRKCIVLHRGKMNSCLIEFTDNKQREVTSRNALRKVSES
jgi:hypothetical protein